MYVVRCINISSYPIPKYFPIGKWEARIAFTSLLPISPRIGQSLVLAYGGSQGYLRVNMSQQESGHRFDSRAKTALSKFNYCFWICRRTQGPPSRVHSSHFRLVSRAGAATPFLIYRGFRPLQFKLKRAFSTSKSEGRSHCDRIAEDLFQWHDSWHDICHLSKALYDK